MVGGSHVVLLLFAKYSGSFLSVGDTPYERPFGMPFNGPVIPFGATVEYHPLSAKDLSRLHQFGPKVLPGFFLWICVTRGENLERRHIDPRH